MRAARQEALSSVDCALRLLMVFRAGTPVRVTDASAELGVSRSTAHRLLTTLEQRGFVRQDNISRAYLVGDTMVALASTMTRNPQLENAALPEMKRLAQRVEETIHLGVLEGTSVRYLVSVESQKIGTRNHMLEPAFQRTGRPAAKPCWRNSTFRKYVSDTPSGISRFRVRERSASGVNWSRPWNGHDAPDTP